MFKQKWGANLLRGGGGKKDPRIDSTTYIKDWNRREMIEGQRFANRG